MELGFTLRKTPKPALKRLAGLKLARWPRNSIAHDSGLPLRPQSATEFTLGIMFRRRQKLMPLWSKRNRPALPP
jgi:hypothetical protein